jgi:hypothetical protein
MDEIQKIADFGSRPAIFADVDTSAGASRGRPLGAIAWDSAVNVVGDLEDAITKIKADPELNDIGKARKNSRACRDAETTFTRNTGHLERLRTDLAEAKALYKPEPANETVSASIWGKLPEDDTAIKMTYNDALSRGDSKTMDAIESLPSVFGGALDEDTLASLKRARMAQDAPEAFAAITTAEEVLHVVETASGIAAQCLQEISKGLPAPDDGADVQTGEDGLRMLSISQFQEAAR